MRQSTFNKYINSLSPEELVDELQLMFSKFKIVKDHYAMELGEQKDREKILTKAKLEIEKKYATKSYRRPRKPRIRLINKVLKELSDKIIFEHEMIDVYLYNVECGLKFANHYRFYSVALSNTITKSFEKASKIISASMLEATYEPRCSEIISTASYEFRISLEELYDQYFVESID